MLVLISEVSSKFRIIKILFAWFTNTTTKAFGHFCRQRLCSRPMHLWSTLQCCLETKPKRASSSPADNVLDSQADSHWSTVLQRLQDNTKGQMVELTCCPASGSSTGLRGQLRLCTFLREMAQPQPATSEIFPACLVFERCAQLTFGRLFQLFATSGLCDWWTSKPQRHVCILGCPW